MNRSLYPSQQCGVGIVNLDFSFATNGASNPLSSTFRGAVEMIQSVTYVATGKYTILLKDKYRYVVAGSADLEDIASPDGAFASLGSASATEGSAGPISIVVSTFTAGGVLTAYSTRRVRMSLVLKNSGVGS